MNILKFSKYTNTTKFILPLLFDERTRYPELLNNFFINAYIADVANKEYDDKIHLLFADYPSLTLQQKLPEALTELEYDDGYVMVYSLDDKWAEDYLKLIGGEYSRISDDAKRQILAFWEENDESPMYSVLYKTGNAVQKLVQQITGSKGNLEWTKSREWWLPFEITDEILGLSN